jgi:hypothetical protein
MKTIKTIFFGLIVTNINVKTSLKDDFIVFGSAQGSKDKTIFYLNCPIKPLIPVLEKRRDIIFIVRCHTP